MRGTRESQGGRRYRFRIIPAHAGNSGAIGSAASGLADHPRACGELSRRRRAWSTPTGSSPRMRGTPDHARRPASLSRIIPAHAGNSSSRFRGARRGARRHPDHPRACGELVKVSTFAVRSPGSSPRMRGTLSQSRPHAQTPRIIPAHAGNSSLRRFGVGLLYGSSPRMRGTLPQDRASLPERVGSSPRMRGTPGHPDRICGLSADHPRACGELTLSR